MLCPGLAQGRRSMEVPVSGTEGYAEAAEALVAQYESLDFAQTTG